MDTNQHHFDVPSTLFILSHYIYIGQWCTKHRAWFWGFTGKQNRYYSTPLGVYSLCLSTVGSGLKIYSWSIQFSCSVMSDSLQPHGLQHARLPCPLPTPRAYLNSCPSSQWCHPTISSSDIAFSFCLQSFPESESFQWVSSSHQVAKVLELQLQHQSFQWIFRTDFL